VRLTLTRGPAPRGLLPPAASHPTLLLTVAALPPPSGPLRLHVSTIRRDQDSPLSAIKSLNYLPNVLARIEAAEAGADDALLLNHAGHVAETSAANLFVCCAGTWITPPVSEGALPGIRRAVLLEAGRVREGVVTAAAVFAADAVCAGNSLMLRPVAEIDGQALPRLALP
jgi:branched-chain amino acid aminotransferase